jgi:hypothetical protein
MGVPVKTGGEKSWELEPASSCWPEGWGDATEGVGGVEELDFPLAATCFRLAAWSTEPRLPSLREGKKGEGDKGGGGHCCKIDGGGKKSKRLEPS